MLLELQELSYLSSYDTTAAETSVPFATSHPTPMAHVWTPRAGLADSIGSITVAFLLCLYNGHLLFVQWDYPHKSAWQIGLSQPDFNWVS